MGEYKVALVSDWYYPKVGGIEYSMHSLAMKLRDIGNEVHIITRQYQSTSYSSSRDGIPIIRVGGSVGGSKYLLEPKAFGNLYHQLKNGGYDIVHTHGLDSPLSIALLLISPILGLPVVVTNHSLIGKSFKKRPLFPLSGVLLRKASAIIAVSSAVEREMKLVTEKPVYLIPNGMDRGSTGKSHDNPFKEDGIVVTTVARMTEKKGVEDVVEIAPSLAKSYRNLTFLMIGEGPVREELQEKVEKSGISRSFYFTGEIPRSKVKSFLECSDIFLLPSKCEAFGISILEAYSKKVPVVARNHSGVSDIVTHRRTGFLAENRYEMAEQVKRLIEKPKVRESMSRAAAEEVSKYRWEEIAKRVEGVYQSVVD